MRIGSVTGARKALSGELPHIGEGCFRAAYLDKQTRTVYKCETDEGMDDSANLIEWQTYTNKPVLPKGFRIVPMRLIDADGTYVIAARFVDGQKMGDCYCLPHNLEPDHYVNCLPDDVSWELQKVGIDPSWGNIIYDGTTYWIVDAQ